MENNFRSTKRNYLIPLCKTLCVDCSNVICYSKTKDPREQFGGFVPVEDDYFDE